jgi:hypothetical protein
VILLFAYFITVQSCLVGFQGLSLLSGCQFPPAARLHNCEAGFYALAPLGSVLVGEILGAPLDHETDIDFSTSAVIFA